MSQTTVIQTVPPTTRKGLDLLELKTVKWIASCYPVSKVTKSLSSAVTVEWKFPILKAIYLIVWRVCLSLFLFFNSLPWPDFLVPWVKAFDNFVEGILEAIDNTVEWWMDCISIIWMRFKEFVVAMVELGLAIGYLCLSSIKTFWTWSYNLAREIIKLVFFPIFQIISLLGDLLNPKKDKTLKHSSSEGTASEISNTQNTDQIRALPPVKINDEESYGTASSEYESDVSVVSETWSMGPTNKVGKYYNRKETKVTAEGRLREAMYKRVKNQLTVMRKNSVRFSEGMASYVRKMMTPKLEPLVTVAYNTLLYFAKKFRLLEVYAFIEKEISKRPLLAQIISLYITIWLMPFAILSGIFSKKKSRRSRSFRSESLKRRLKAQENSAQNPANVLSPSALRQSAEPVQNHVNQQLQEDLKPKLKNDHDEDSCPARDSALASSVDDLPSSDSGEGGSYSLTDQVIKEEVESELNLDKENIHASSEESLKDKNLNNQKDSPHGENGYYTDPHTYSNGTPDTFDESKSVYNYAKAVSSDKPKTATTCSQEVKPNSFSLYPKNSRKKTPPGDKRKHSNGSKQAFN